MFTEPNKAVSLLDVYAGSWRYAAAIGAFIFAMSGAVQANTLYDNLSSETGDTVNAAGASWLAQALTTNSTSYVLQSVTLLLDAEATPSVSIYSDNGGEPGWLIQPLSLSSSYSSSLSNVTFTSSGLTLNAGTTYWVVLSDNVSADWAWTTSNSGSGAAFSTTSALTEDAGATWFTADAYPYQMSVTAVAAVPLPAGLPLFLSALAGARIIGRRKAA